MRVCGYDRGPCIFISFVGESRIKEESYCFLGTWIVYAEFHLMNLFTVLQSVIILLPPFVVFVVSKTIVIFLSDWIPLLLVPILTICLYLFSTFLGSGEESFLTVFTLGLAPYSSPNSEALLSSQPLQNFLTF